MAIKDIPLELIDDNPYNPRKHYPQTKIKEMALSLLETGLLQVPPGREVHGRVQLAYGHMRLRGFRYNQKHERCVGWGTMPVDVKPLSDQDMFDYSLEENLRRTDITPLETARCIENFSQLFPDILDEEIAKRHSMTAANVSNMKRVLRLPEKFLTKIDEGKITFTQGRELLILEGLPDAEQLMSEALSRIGSQYGEPNTVEGLQKAIHGVIKNHFPPLEKEWAGYHYDLLFDTRAAGCLECKKMLRTHPTKTGVAHFCSDETCWQAKQEEHRQNAAAVARAKMEAEVLERAARELAKQAPMAPTPVLLWAISDRWMEKVAKDHEALAMEREGRAELDQIEAELETRADERDRQLEDARERANLERPAGEVPCETCLKGQTCDRAFFYAADDDSGRLVCDQWETPLPTHVIPDGVLQKAKEAVGTRAEVLDLKDLRGKADYTVLKGIYGLDELRNLDEPDECLSRCTQGFHYAYDSSYRFDGYGRDYSGLIHFVCTNPKCVAQKKGALTRKKNAAGLLRKNTEKKAIKEAVEMTKSLSRPQMNLILLTQTEDRSFSHYYGGSKSPSKWLWDRLSAGTKSDKRADAELWKILDKLNDGEIARLITEMMFARLTYSGDDLQNYEIRTTKPLKWFGIEIPMGKEEMAA